MKIKVFTIFIIFFIILQEKSFSRTKNFEYLADNIKYQNNKNLILAEGNAKIFDDKGRTIYSEKITYDKNNGIIRTYNNTRFTDKIGNEILSKDLLFNTLTKELIIKDKVRIYDNKKNQFFLDDIIYNIETRKGVGNNFLGIYSDNSTIKSKKINFDLTSGKASFEEAYYTTCKNEEIKKGENCSWWSLATSKTFHDQSKKTLIHKNALLKIKKLPVLYIPYLAHPDPTVTRKSGFLPPGFKNLSSLGRTFELPYFWSINESFDATITPVYYFNEKPLVLTEIRKKFKNSLLIIDSSYTQGYKNTTNEPARNSGSRNHFYLNYYLDFENKFFQKNNINFQIRKVSQENYLKVNQINTLLTKENDKKLENKIQLLAFNEKSGLDISAKIFEDLNQHTNDKYEYVFPTGSYAYNITKFNNNINLKSSFSAKKYHSEQEASDIINEINTTSSNKTLKTLGTSHVLKTRLTNINKYRKDRLNSDNAINNYFTIALDNSLPLYKKNKNQEQIINPKLFLKYTTGSMENEKKTDQIFLYSDVYSMNRSSNISNPETGLSLGLGVDYEMSKKDENHNKYFKNVLGVGQVFRTNKLDQMPEKTSLNNKQSSFTGFYNISLLGKNKSISNQSSSFIKGFDQNTLDFKYNFNLDKGLSRVDQNQATLNATIFNRINASISFDEKNNYAGDERNIDYGFSFLINKNFYFSSNIEKNLKEDFKEYERVGIFYENDCIKIGLNIKKDYYNNDELSNKKSIFLSIILKPFGNDLSPDLSSFVQ